MVALRFKHDGPLDVISEARTTIQNSAWILLQRGLHAASGVVFALLVPRLMGPDIYGRYSLLTSLSIWFVLFSGLNLVDVIGRYAPEFILKRDKEGLQDFFGDLLTVRLASGILATGLYLGVTVTWLRDLDPWVLVIVAGTVFVRAISDLLFAVFVGLNQASRWQMGETLRQWVSLGILLPGFHLGGLRGAVLALLLTELIVLFIGVYWIRLHLAWPGLHLDVRRSIPYLQFGLVFFASDVLNTALGASGETMVRVITGDYVEVAYFGLAHRVFVTMALAIPQLALAFTPLLTALLAQGHIETLKRWLERLLKYLSLGGVFAVFGTLLLADDLVPLVLGAAYRPVAANLVPLTLTFLAMAAGNVARLLAVIYLQPRVALGASALRFVAFWVLGIPLVASLGSLGACVAMLAASLLHAGYFTWYMRRALRYSLRGSLLAIGLGIVFLPLVWLGSSWGTNMLLYSAFVLGYSVMLLLLRVLSRSEVAQLWQALAHREGMPKPSV